MLPTQIHIHQCHCHPPIYSAPSSLFQKVAIKKIQSPKKIITWKGGHFMTYYTLPKTKRWREDTSWHITRRANAPKARFQHFAAVSLHIHVKFLNNERGKEKDRWCRRLCYWLNSSYIVLLIIFQVSFSFNLLVANWRLLPEFWSPKIFSTHHGDQNASAWGADICKSKSCFLQSFSNLFLYQFNLISVTIGSCYHRSDIHCIIGALGSLESSLKSWS